MGAKCFFRPNHWDARSSALLDLIANQEVVHQEADPAESHDGDREEDLVKGLKLVVLEDVEHAPHGGDDAQDVDNGSDHNSIILRVDISGKLTSAPGLVVEALLPYHLVPPLL